ncbi:unnamed protein product [Paramecium pentaurelia]|uniref:Uncharacterized protein n=1 Tax=Paramecium pentaurelia TaxID=43138 RepID=A0A8S1U1U8_9CILI|nr:unnamed protein product [Paramecium pentaurelia]
MIQQDLNQEEILKIIEIKLKTSVKGNFIDKIISLLFILEWNLQKAKFLNFQQCLIIHDSTDLQKKLLGLNTNQINPKLVFKSSYQIDIKSNEKTREIFLEKFRVFFIDCQEKQIKYLISKIQKSSTQIIISAITPQEFYLYIMILKQILNQHLLSNMTMIIFFHKSSYSTGKQMRKLQLYLDRKRILILKFILLNFIQWSSHLIFCSHCISIFILKNQCNKLGQSSLS